MELTQDKPSDRLYIQAADDSSITIDGIRHTHCLHLTEIHVTEWPASSIDKINEESLAPIIASRPALLLIGTGREHRPLDPATTALLMQHGIGVEVMTTAAACRTYNLLAVDGRPVVAILLLR
ncbi:MAG: membrane protein [marine bacterium B5-7]|nr:MAG: membrane protein [marine bacterium B5-7]